MPKATLQFGEWRPDIALLDNQYATDAENVFTTANSYQPIPSLLPFSNAMVPDPPVLGLTAARLLSGLWAIYAGTKTRLYRFTLSGWQDVTRSSGPYNVPDGERWVFAQFGSNLTATQFGDTVQVINVDDAPATTRFADLGGNPPLAHNAHVIGDFLVLGGLADNRRSVRWSGIDNVVQWTIGNELCDQQEMPDCGIVQGVAGNEGVGYIVQDRGIRLLQFLPGDIKTIFNITRAVKDRGSVSEYGFDTVADTLYFLSEDGFYSLTGTQLNAIGEDKVNRWFLANSDIGRRNQVQCFTSNRPYVIWAYHSNSATPIYDKIIIYNWVTQRWSRGSIYAQAWAQLATIPLDLDTTGSEPGDYWLDAGTGGIAFQPNVFQPNVFQVTPYPATTVVARSLDSFFYRGGRPKVCAVDENGILGALEGPSLQANIETTEAHLVPGMRAFVNDVYPLVDSDRMQVTAGLRERLGDDIAWGSPLPVEVTGSASLLTSSRLHRFRITTPPGDTWSNAQAVLVEAQPDGMA